MASSAIQLISAVALIDSDGRVLLAERPEGKIFAGYWEFPGGKIETGETPEAALVRELDEEMGVDTKDSCLAPLGFVSHPYDTHHMVLLLYVCRKWSGRPQPKEGGQLKWVAPARLRDFEMPPANKELISVIQDLL
ncbi:MAG: 8-oxo-dGTP diphosphatase MutT [Candidatus Puniceispirillaceae bacterium]